MVGLIEVQRRQYEVHQPVMWKRAANAEGLIRQFFEKQLGDAAAVALVFERAGQITGFLIAKEISGMIHGGRSYPLTYRRGDPI